MDARKKLGFIVGAPRSGTTWLQLVLSQSPQVATAQETHLFSQYLRSLFTSWRTFSKDNRRTGLSALISEQMFLKWVGGFADCCLGEVCAKRPNAKIVVEKTPDHGSRTADILKIYPHCYFIHVIRDPRGVVGSLRAASAGWGERWAPGRIHDACVMWEDRLVQAQSASQQTSRYCEVLYERLHDDGPGEIMRLFDWFGEPIGPADAEEYFEACAIKNLRSGAANAPWDLKAEPEAFFRRGEVDSWRRELSATEIAIVERLTKKQMAKLGYEPVSGRRARLAAKTRLRAYRYADRFAKAVRAGADRIKP
jgi:hypothetical protein